MPLPFSQVRRRQGGATDELEEGEEAAPGRPELPLFLKRVSALLSLCQVQSTCSRATSTYAKLVASSAESA